MNVIWIEKICVSFSRSRFPICWHRVWKIVPDWNPFDLSWLFETSVVIVFDLSAPTRLVMGDEIANARWVMGSDMLGNVWWNLPYLFSCFLPLPSRFVFPISSIILPSFYSKTSFILPISSCLHPTSSCLLSILYLPEPLFLTWLSPVVMETNWY